MGRVDYRTRDVAAMILERFCYSPLGTFGRMFAPEFMVWTVERPWANNAPRESCIPEGVYPLVSRKFNRGGYMTWEVTDVPNRSLILVHKANTMNDLLGCIAPGKRLGALADRDDAIPLDWGVLDSAGAFDEFMRAMERERDPKVLIITHRVGDGIL